MKNKSLLYSLGLSSALLYYLLFYEIGRNETLLLMLIYVGLFAIYIYFIYSKNDLKIKEIIMLAALFRLLSIISIPNLSDDFYRFIWDGIVWTNGINPFAYRPVELFAGGLLPQTDFIINIYSHLNADDTYTVYPIIPQLINVVAYGLGGENLVANIIIQRLFILAAEGLSLYFLLKILYLKQWPLRNVVIYALNPLVILELAGNLHHEALMISFLLGFIYLDMRSRAVGSGLMFALAIGAKLLPLMFLPYLLLKSRAKLVFFVTILLGMLIIFSPLFTMDFIHGLGSSLQLYYQKFEFNAGLYYLLRAIGYWLYGYNAIAVIGKLLFLLTGLLIIGYSIRGIKLKTEQLLVLTIVYLFYTLGSLILHPWYILLLLALAPLTRLRFSIYWSLLIFITYSGYSEAGYSENYWLLLIEYLGLAIALYFDWRNQAFAKETLKEAP